MMVNNIHSPFHETFQDLSVDRHRHVQSRDTGKTGDRLVETDSTRPEHSVGEREIIR